jgi:hypothetical protein
LQSNWSVVLRIATINLYLDPTSTDLLNYILDSTEYQMNDTNNNTSITNYHLLIEPKSHNQRLCQFVFCVYPSNLNLTHLLNIDTIRPNRFDQLKSPNWLNHASRRQLHVEFTIINNPPKQQIEFATIHMRNCD